MNQMGSMAQKQGFEPKSQQTGKDAGEFGTGGMSQMRTETPPEQAPQPKKDFKDPFQMQGDMVAGKKKSAEAMVNAAVNSETDSMIEKANSAISSFGGSDDFGDFEKLNEISDEDIELAEQVIFKGYAEKEVTIPNLPGHKFTICTTSAEDMSVIDEIIFDMVHEHEDKDGQIDLPAQHVQTMRSALILAMGFVGMDGEEYCDEPVHKINAIKRGVIKVKDYEYEGDLEKAKALNGSLKKSLKHRAVRVRRLPTPVIDFLSNAKFEFDTTMYQIMTSKQLIPKSSGQQQDTQEPNSSEKENSSSTDL